ncbi:sodium channel protein Nach-like [Ochlerotatus camptorhynchus]|uniref:sodium channel protein Nach-like n=1 Tax=Ochlerotatus camptorhynchus TaxID=644619 RepID=UPI0031DB5927
MAYQFYISKFFQRVISKSSLHGAYHLSAPKHTMFERYLWGTLIVSTVLYSSYLITLFWIRYLTNPTVISLDRNYHEWNTTFPSITVCFHDRLNTTARDILIQRMKPKNATKFMEFLNLLAETDISNFDQLIEFDEYSNLDLEAILNAVVNQIHVNVTLSNGMEAKFHRIISELGVCYTFNSAILRYLSVGTNVSNNSSQELVEISIIERETTAALNNLSCNGNIFYHGPFEVPTFLKKLVVPSSASAFVKMSFKPVIIMADATIENLYVKQRNCRYPHESNLQLFPEIYSYSLCSLECKLTQFLETCGCVPHLYKFGGFPMCSLGNLGCVSKNLLKVHQNASSCGCLKDCTLINFTLQSYLLLDWFNSPLIKWDIAVSKIRYSRRIIFNFSDAMVSTGGIAALFFGASFVTLAEIMFLIVKTAITQEKKI